MSSMEKTVSSRHGPECFGDLPQGESTRGDRYVAGQDGAPLGTLVPFSLYPRWKRQPRVITSWRSPFRRSSSSPVGLSAKPRPAAAGTRAGQRDRLARRYSGRGFFTQSPDA
jgi:hypothetical protein